MENIKQSNWADEDDIDSDEDTEFGLEAAQAQSEQQHRETIPEKVS